MIDLILTTFKGAMFLVVAVIISVIIGKDLFMFLLFSFLVGIIISR